MDVLQYQLKSKAACFLIFSFRNANRTHLFSPVKTTFHAELCNPITCQAIELESCSNPLRIQQVLQSKSKKNFFRFRWGFSGGNATSGGVFSYLYLALGPNLLGHYYDSRFFRKLGQNPLLWSP